MGGYGRCPFAEVGLYWNCEGEGCLAWSLKLINFLKKSMKLNMEVQWSSGTDISTLDFQTDLKVGGSSLLSAIVMFPQTRNLLSTMPSLHPGV